MRADQAYEELLRRVREEALLTSCEALLEWDEETYMPPGGVENRSEQLALLAGLLHERGTNPRIGELLAEVEGSELLADRRSPEAVTSMRDNSCHVPGSTAESGATCIGLECVMSCSRGEYLRRGI